MENNFKNIHIGELIEKRFKEINIEMDRVVNFFHCSEKEIKSQFYQESLDSNILLKWCKLLEYDFFRLYTNHIILYSPPAAINVNQKSSLPQFRKNIYTKELIEFILELIDTGEKTKSQVISDYRIPKTTLYKWISKYNNNNNERARL